MYKYYIISRETQTLFLTWFGTIAVLTELTPMLLKRTAKNVLWLCF